MIEDTNLDQETLVMKMRKESDDKSAEKLADSKNIMVKDIIIYKYRTGK
ncbi:MAG: hypothetical protein KHY23_13660 [Clostridium sp.]|nr:hypothetical protein [Clostridium sp.]